MLYTFLRFLIGFAVILLMVRIVGNKQIGQTNVFTYISGIVVGNMVAEVIMFDDVELWKMAIVVVWFLLTVLVELIALKSSKARELLDGQPVILIKRGKINYGALKKERLNIDDLTMLLRTNDVFSVTEVDYAILETNGDLSVLKKQAKNEVTKEDMKIPETPSNYMPSAVIIDGKIVGKNLKEFNLTEKWLDKKLKDMNFKSRAEVLYAELQENGQLYVQAK